MPRMETLSSENFHLLTRLGEILWPTATTLLRYIKGGSTPSQKATVGCWETDDFLVAATNGWSCQCIRKILLQHATERYTTSLAALNCCRYELGRCDHRNFLTPQ